MLSYCVHKAFPSELQATLPHDSMQTVDNQVHQTATKTSDMSADGHLTAWFLIRCMPLMGNGCPDLACSHVAPDLQGDEETHPPYLNRHRTPPEACKLIQSHLSNLYILVSEDSTIILLINKSFLLSAETFI